MADIDDVEAFVSRQASKAGYPRLLVWKDLLFHPDKTLAAELTAPSLARGAKDVFAGSYIYSATLLLCYLMIIEAGVVVISGITAFGAKQPVACAVPFAALVVGVLAAAILAALLAALAVLAWLAGAAVTFVLAKLLGGNGAFVPQAHAYGTITAAAIVAYTPFMLLSIIPCVGYVFSTLSLLLSLYSVYIQYKAVRMVHGLDQGRAAAVVLLPVAFGLLVAMAIFAAYFLLVLGVFAAGAGKA